MKALLRALHLQLPRLWLGHGPLARMLWPLSMLYRLLLGLHGAPYALPRRRPARVPALVVVVGNVVAGGAGKTPLTIALAHHLRQRGLAVGVVSRGYGRQSQQTCAVLPDSKADEVGDEPLLIQRATGVPVWVGRQRAAAARALLQSHPQVRVILCDDGLQHRSLARDIEICILDERGIGNGWLLPAGPLREPWPRRVDLLLGCDAPAGMAPWSARRRLADTAHDAQGRHVSLSTLAAAPGCNCRTPWQCPTMPIFRNGRHATQGGRCCAPKKTRSNSGRSNRTRWRWAWCCCPSRLFSRLSTPCWSSMASGSGRYHPPMDNKLLELLVCPVTKGPLDWDAARSARLAYPVRDGIPILLENEARPLSDAEMEQLALRRPHVA